VVVTTASRIPAFRRCPRTQRLLAALTFYCLGLILGSGSDFETDVRPFLDSNCQLCHNGNLKMAEIAFDGFADEERALGDAALWHRVERALASGKMPPSGRPKPAQAKIDAVLAWIRSAAPSEIDEPVRADPGRVTARRLNRAEYNNTVRDLLGVDLRPADEFPVDDTGYGFDNIGDVLSLSPILMEKYLSAAGKLARTAIITDREVAPTIVRHSAPRAEDDAAQIGESLRLEYSAEGRLQVRHYFPATGDYELLMKFVDRRNIPTRRPEWMHRLGEIRRQITALDQEAITRTDVIEYAGISSDQSGRFLRTFGARRVNGDYAAPKQALLKRIADMEQDVEANPEPPPPPPTPALPVVFRLDGKELASYIATKEEGDWPRPETIRLRIEAGEHELLGEFVDDQGEPSNPNGNGWKEYRNANTKNAKRMLFVDYVEIQGPHDAEPAPLPESHRRIIPCEPERESFDEACAETVLRRLTRFAFRRPVNAADIEPLVDFARQAVESGQTFEQGVQLGLKALLVSPEFLFRIERDPDPNNPNAHHPLSPIELASRLSYFLWSSMPDEELLRAAETGELQLGKELNRQVARMVRDPKSQAFVEGFAGQWLQLRNLSIARPDPDLFPGFNSKLADAMVRETEMLFAYVMREDRSVLEFLNADYSFLNERLAKHYGIEGVEGEELRRVELAGEQRGGVLTHASVLTVSSYPRRTSPVLRGLWVLENLLGAPPPAPPPNVPELDEEAVGKASSLREELEKHRANPTCAVCHDSFDPLGFGLENYDPIGAWREKDGAFAIDASGVLPDGRRFSGSSELRQILYSQGDQFAVALIRKMLTYALGRGLERYDEAVVEQIRASAASKQYRFSALLEGVVESMPFQMRRGEVAAEGESR